VPPYRRYAVAQARTDDAAMPEKLAPIFLLLLLLAGPHGLASPAGPAAFDPDQPTVLITGANRGLGLEFARQYAALGWNVIATCRRPGAAAALRSLAAGADRVAIETLDVTLDADVARVAAKYRDQPVDLLLNNAGIYGDLEKQTLGSFDFEELKRVLDVNTIGALRMSEAFLDNVRNSGQKKIVSLGGGMGTPTIGSMFGGHYFMKMSKAAHISAMGTLQKDLEDTGIIVTMISPGRVATQMLEDSGWTGKSISPAESAALVIAMIGRLEPEMGGRVVMYNGRTIPW
jgi:NAD(P)-dependent dehydrogenase (short-subunit alcohol dehydrogenase family)